MVRLGNGVLSRGFLRTFDLDGNQLEYSEIDINYSIWDAAFGGDGIWLGETRGVTKIGMDGKVLLGPFLTPMGGPIEKLIFDGQHIWVLEDVDNSPDVVSRISQDGQVLDTFTVGTSGGGLVSDGEGVWVTTGEDYEWPAAGGYRIPTTGALWKITPD